MEPNEQEGIPQKPKLSKEEVDKLKEQERLEILQKAKEVKGEQLNIGPTGELTTEAEIKKFVLGDVDDPARKHEVYYHGIDKLLRRELPKGKKYKKARDLVLEEKNIFLTRGKIKNSQGIRGADSRMGYISDMEEALQLISDWILSGGTMLDLYIKFNEKNKQFSSIKE